MELFLSRFEMLPRSTVGKLHIDAVDRAPHCFTVEDAMREVAGQPVSMWKNPKQTAIPVGRYEVLITWSNRFNRRMPLLVNVPGFDGIRIHVANTELDVEGCIGVGMSHDRPGFVGRSSEAFGILFIELDAALRSGKAYITISNPVAQ